MRSGLIFEDPAFQVSVTLPYEVAVVPEADLRPPDVSKLSGARVVRARGWDGDAALVVRAGCARGPADRFVPGVEDVLFEKATWFALEGSGAKPAEIFVARARDTDRTFERRLEGRDDVGAVTVEHLLAFAGAHRDAVLCSVACRGPAAECAKVTLRIEGQSAPLPEPSWWIRGVLLAAEHPATALAAALAATVAVVAVLLWRRPYPRP